MKPKPTTHCIYGHALNSETLYVSPKGNRKCRVCEATRYSIAKGQRKKDTGPKVAGRPSPEMVADAKRRASVPRNPIAEFMGDPPPGRSALDKKMGKFDPQFGGNKCTATNTQRR